MEQKSYTSFVVTKADMEDSTRVLYGEYKAELEQVNRKIAKLNGASYTDQVANSFYLGMVGGSGKNVRSLNNRRNREIERTVKNAVELVPLYDRRDHLTATIERMESGEYDKDKADKADKKERTIISLVNYWNNLKAGDKVDLGGNAPLEITKKNKKSIETGAGCKWTAYEVIGKDASARL